MALIQNNLNHKQYLSWLPGKPTLAPKGSLFVADPLVSKALLNPILQRDMHNGVVSVFFGTKTDTPSGRITPPSRLMSALTKKSDASFSDLGIPVTFNGPAVINRPAPDRTIPKDLALIMCHYGQREENIKAAKEALAITLPHAPFTIIVECAEKDQPRHFTDIPNTLYMERTLTDRSRGLWLKEALWTIGAREAMGLGYEKLLFLDMDCSFGKQDWASEISNALEHYDVMSPHEYTYRANQPDGTKYGVRHTKGKSWSGFPGMGLAMTSTFFKERLNSRIDCYPDSSGDTMFWVGVIGCPQSYGFLSTLNHDLTQIDCKGMAPRPRVGYTHQVLAHHPHGPIDSRNYRAKAIITRASFPIKGSAIEYLEDGMPTTPDTPAGRICRASMQRVYASQSTLSRKDGRDIYDEEAVKEYGAIDEDHPLIVTVALRSGGIYSGKHVKWLKKQFDKHCKTPYRFVCQSDVEIDGVETIPFITTNRETPFQWCQIEHYRNIWPKGASVLTCDIDTVVVRDFTPHRCPVNEFFMLREFGEWKRAHWVTWGGGLTYFRGDFSPMFDTYMKDIKHGLEDNPAYSFIGAQEHRCNALRMMGVSPKNIISHFCPRYYNDGGTVLDDAHFAIFPSTPKPWDLNLPWIPRLEQ